MILNKSSCRPFVAVAALAVAALPSPVFASGFQLVEQNASGLGNAYSGQAAGVKDASAVFFNPAALVNVPGKNFAFSVSPIGIATDFTDAGSGRPFLPPGTPISGSLGGNGGDAGGWVPVPNAYLSWQVSEKAWLGLGLNVPFGLKTEWDDDWLGRFHAVKSEIKTYNINPSVAFEVAPGLSLGGGVNYQKLDAELSQSVPYGGLAFGAAAQAAGPAAALGILAQLGGPAGLVREGFSVVEGDSWAWGWNVGLLAKLGERGRLGVTYRSAVKHDLEGTVSFDNAPTFATAGPLGALGAGLNSRFTAGPVTAAVELPDTLSVAAAYEGEKIELLADWTRTGWDSIQSLDIFRGDGSALSSTTLRFKNTWRVGLGLNYKLDPDWTLRFGYAHDKAPVRDVYRTPRLPDQDRNWAAAGIRRKLGKGALDLGYAHLFVKDATSVLVNIETLPAPFTGTPKGNLRGTYGADINILTIGYNVTF
jgi:long-chain fatty acid transport protein